MCFHRYGHDAKVVHFLGKVKPWNLTYDAQRGEVKGRSTSPDVYQMHPDYLLLWWQLYSRSVLPLLQRAYGDTPFNSGFVEAAEEDVSCAYIEVYSKKKKGWLSACLCSNEMVFFDVYLNEREKIQISEFLSTDALEEKFWLFVFTITGKKLICSTFFRTSLRPTMFFEFMLAFPVPLVMPWLCD